ncbi:MAG: DUF4252 domain-containing protein [Bacteroidetes bacterium]|nr:DUF4252 domain-containing protein [Bacteroidota bacterium]MCB0852300.1 DUF4252 domain-containing protein [Bacteroidota bacterium]
MMNSIKLTGMIIFLMISSLGALAQTSIDRYFNQYQDDERFSRVSVSSRMFNLFMELKTDDPNEEAFLKTISKLTGLKVLIGKEVDEAKTLYSGVVNRPAKEMDELMTVSETGKEFRFYIREAGGKISELLMVGYEGKQVMIMSLTGDIDLKEIAKLSKQMNIEGFENFKNVEK